jgi:hypothetical protein
MAWGFELLNELQRSTTTPSSTEVLQAAHNAPDAPKAPTIPEITEVRLCIAMEKFWSLQLEAELQFIDLLTTYIV